MPGKRKRSVTPLMIGHPPGDKDVFGRTAEHFFAEGEEHEAQEWDDVLPLDDEPDPRRRGGSLDKLPRRWSAVFALVALCVCLVSGVAAAGFALFAKGRVGGPIATIRSWLSVTSRESTSVLAPNPIPPATPPQTNPAPLGSAPTPSQATPPAPSALPPDSDALSIPAKIPRHENKAEQAAPLPDVEGQERLRKDATTRRRRHHSQLRDNYVWSTELNALVPASSPPAADPWQVQSGAAAGRAPKAP